ncbi:MAG: M48 family metallopeptidase [Candidatus Riflebacteria bacterium]|nr:M48 family metallopeptidase [Candidatus Riflebacteria bacterium]
MTRLFWLLIFAWVVLRLVMLYLGWNGNSDNAARERVLKHFTSEDIARGREYVRNGFWGRVASPFVTVGLMAILLQLGMFTRIFDRIAATTGNGWWTTNLIFIFSCFAILQIAELPFDYYLGYLVEKRMGFSNMTSIDWVYHYLKMSAVSWIFQAAGVMLVLWVFKVFPRGWPVGIPVATTLFGIAVTLIVPILVTPLFYNQKPLGDGPLKQRIIDISTKAGVQISGIYEIDESRYSNHTNAYFTGLFSQKRIVLYDTLIKSHTVDEAALIFAHEVGHWKHDHVFIGLALGFLGTLLGCGLLWFVFPILRTETLFSLRELDSACNLPFFLIVTVVGNLFFAPVEAQISQIFERQADATSLELTGLASVFIDAEKRLARDNRSELLPHPFRVFWLYSHPPAIERIAMAEAYTALHPEAPLPASEKP